MRSQSLRISQNRLYLVEYGGDTLVKAGAVKSLSIYDAPEIRNGENPTFESDLWSAGLIAAELLSGIDLAFQEIYLTNDQLMQLIRYLRGTSGIPHSISSLIEKLLRINPSDRYIDAVEVLHEIEGYSELPNFDVTDWLANVDLVGRENTKKILEELLDSLVQNISNVFLVHGVAGTGKSTLLDYIEGLAPLRKDVIVSKSTAQRAAFTPSVESGGYMIWQNALRTILALHGAFGEIASREAVQPIIQPLYNDSLAFNRALSVEEAIEKLFEELLISPHTAQKKIVLLLDNLQWVEEDSRRAIRNLIRGIHEKKQSQVPVLLIVTYRDGVLDANLSLKDLKEELGILDSECIPLERLNDADLIELHSQLSRIMPLGDQNTFCDTVIRYTGGIPFLVLKPLERFAAYNHSSHAPELLDILREEFSQGLISKSLNALEVKRFLASCAAAGKEFDIQVLKTLFTEVELEKFMYICLQEGALEGYNNYYEFPHDLWYEKALEWLPTDPIEKQNIYYKIALAYSETEPSNARRRAELWEEAGESTNALHDYLIAAQREYDNSAYSTSQKLLGKLEENGVPSPVLNVQEILSFYLLQHRTAMGLGNLDEALKYAKEGVRQLTREVIEDHDNALEIASKIFRASARQFLYRLRIYKPKSSLSWQELNTVGSFYRALTNPEYFKNNIWRLFYYALQCLNLADELGVRGRGEKADLYATGILVMSMIGYGGSLLSHLYQELASRDFEFCKNPIVESWFWQMQALSYAHRGLWNNGIRAIQDCEQSADKGKEQRRKEEGMGIRYMLYWYSGKWKNAWQAKNEMRESPGFNEVNEIGQSQVRSWFILLNAEEQLCKAHLYKIANPKASTSQNDFADRLKELIEARNFQAKTDQSAWLRATGILAQLYLHVNDIKKAKEVADEFLNVVSKFKRYPVPFYAAEGFFGTLEVYLKILANEPADSASKSSAYKILWHLHDKPLLAYDTRFEIAKPRALVYKAQFSLLTESRDNRAYKYALKALYYAQKLNMPYDEWLIHRFIIEHAAQFSVNDVEKLQHQNRAQVLFSSLLSAWDQNDDL
ncbi:MAG: AAA family ATPase [Parachlamydiaceae bacterium]|nr:AAA family ATPase [Parachlamydiaceae bacterium]